MNAICNLCKSPARKTRRVPAFAMGRAVFEKFACDKCADIFGETLAGFWGVVSTTPAAGRCGYCGRSLDNKMACLAHKTERPDGIWESALLCEGCFKCYIGLCRETAAKCGGK